MKTPECTEDNRAAGHKKCNAYQYRFEHVNSVLEFVKNKTVFQFKTNVTETTLRWKPSIWLDLYLGKVCKCGAFVTGLSVFECYLRRRIIPLSACDYEWNARIVWRRNSPGRKEGRNCIFMINTGSTCRKTCLFFCSVVQVQ